MPERRPLLPPPHAEAVERGYVSYEDAKAAAALSDISHPRIPPWVFFMYAVLLVTSPCWLVLAFALLVKWFGG